jgi:hypothetical protein
MVIASIVHAREGQYGCGLVGHIPGINGGVASAEMQRVIDGLKKTNGYGKVSYWNWNYAPQGGEQALTSEFIFMPENYGMTVAKDEDLRPAMRANFLDTDGQNCPALMGDILLGANEPDMTGSCMGGMFGKCTASCTQEDVDSHDCPVSHLHAAQGSEHPNSHGRCDCYSDSHATGAGFWPLEGCSGNQPLPELFKDSKCVSVVKRNNAQTGALAAAKGYKFLSTPLHAFNMEYMKSFVRMACSGCPDISCGCPTHVAWHFYANDCRPVSLGGYDHFQSKLDATLEIMAEFPHLQGAIVNEVGMLNCAMDTPDAPCIVGSGKYPADQQPMHTCPPNDELPNGMSSFLETLISMAAKAKTRDGRSAVASFSWFNQNSDGGTYDLRLFDESGNLNTLGETYLAQCQAWAAEVIVPTLPAATPPVATPLSSPAAPGCPGGSLHACLETCPSNPQACIGWCLDKCDSEEVVV